MSRLAVRRERVILDLEDRLSDKMVKAAAATALLDKQLNSLSGRSVASHRALATTERDVSNVGRSSESSGRQIDKLSGRLQILAEVAGAVGPALIPIGAAAVPAIAGLANQLGVAALAGGTAVLAFQGVGTALKAMNDYQLAPTAAHLLALQEAMSAVGPAGRDFVRQLAEMEPLFKGIQNTARQGLFPGVTDALQGIATRAPEVNHLIETISTTLGGLMSEAGQGIEGGALDAFIRSLDTEARPALTQLGHSIADVTLGLASLMQAFMPLSLGFGAGMERAAAGFKTWADGLSQTQGFKDFVAYIQSTGPQVLSLLGALGNDFVQIVEAAAPLGGPILESLTAIAKAIGAIADSPLGTPIFTAISAISAYNLALKATTSLQRSAFAPAMLEGRIGKTRSSLTGLTADLGVVGRSWLTAGANSERESARVAASGKRVGESLRTVGKGAALLTGVGLAATGASDKLGVTNTVTLGLAGSFAGPWGAALGAGAGALLDVQHAAAPTTDAIHSLNTALTETGPAAQKMQDLTAALAAADKQLADMQNHSGVGDWFGDMVNKIGSFNVGDLFKPSGKPVDPFGLGQVGTNGLDKLKSTAAQARAELAQGTPVAQVYAQSIRNAGVAAGHTQAEINGMVAAMQANKQAAGDAFAAETQYRQALKDARAQAAKNNAGIRSNSDAAIANRTALEQLRTAWNNQSDAVKNNVGRYHEARSAFIQTAVAMGVPIARARQLARSLLDIPKSVVVKTQIAGGPEALRMIEAIKAQLANIPRRLQTDYYVNQINSVSKMPTNFDPTHGKYGADGATVVDSGRPYADRHLYLVADREEIVSNRRGQADRYRPVLKAINADMPREQIRGMLAGGGTAGWGTPSWSGNWHMPPAQTPNLGNWYHQILAAIRDGLGGSGSGGPQRVREKVSIDGVGVFSVTRADRDNAKFIATLVHQTHREKAADRLAELQAMQQIRDFQKQLSAHNKKKKDGSGGGLSLTGLDRKETLAELAQAQQGLKDLRSHADGAKQAIQQVKDALNTKRSGLQSAASGLNIDQALGKQPTNPVATQVHDSLAQFKQQILDAGGVWTKHLRDLSTKTIAQAMAIDKDNRAIDAATVKQDTLTQHLGDLTSQMDSLTSTMSQFGSTVGGNFLSNPFGLGGQAAGGPDASAPAGPSPALLAATDQLNAAKAHLAALSTGDGDINTRLANAYAAQSVASDVAKLQAQVDQLSQATSQTAGPIAAVTSSLQSFKDMLTADTTKANAFNAALAQLSAEGLSTDVFSALAQSGDLDLATELAAAGQSAVSDINTLWQARATAAAQVAAYATQTVYGQQQAILQGQINQQNALITANKASIDQLNAAVATLGQRVEAGAAAGVAGLAGQISAISDAVAALPKQLDHVSK